MKDFKWKMQFPHLIIYTNMSIDKSLEGNLIYYKAASVNYWVTSDERNAQNSV